MRAALTETDVQAPLFRFRLVPLFLGGRLGTKPEWANKSLPEISGTLSMAEIVWDRRERREAAAAADTAPPSPLRERARMSQANRRPLY